MTSFADPTGADTQMRYLFAMVAEGLAGLSPAP
jgi:hypothetical protein